MLGKYKITINVEIERANDPDENIIKNEPQKLEEYSNCGCNCDICSLDSSDNEDKDNIDYDKYDKGWDYMDYLNPERLNSTFGDHLVSDYINYVSEMVKRDDSGRFAKGNIPTTKRGPGGRFVKSS